MDPAADRGALVARATQSNAVALGAVLVLLLVIEVVDVFVFDDALQQRGIGPRRIDRLDGIIWAPFLHSGPSHLFANAVPFAVLGWLVALRGRRYWGIVTIAGALGGGALVWLLAGGTNHIGASGVIFGYLGALLSAAALERHPAALARALVAVLLYGTMLVGLVPQERISWEGHLFGFLVGIVVAARMTDAPQMPTDDEPRYDWEHDKPWLTDD